MPVALEAFYLPSSAPASGHRYCILRRPADRPCTAAMVYLHPLAEEMNKSRRMVSLQAQALAESGIAVLQIDLQGCGDSSGDFSDASWDGWLGDATDALQWMRQRHAGVPLWLWGLRSGALVASEASRKLELPVSLLFWQPALEGSQVLQHFLRLQVLGNVIDGQAPTTVGALRQRLLSTGSIEVGGYVLTPRLANGLEAARLQPPRPGTRVVWLEVSSMLHPRLIAGSPAAIERWQAAGCKVNATAVNGPAFWQSNEIEEAPELLTATLAQLREPALP